MPALRCADGLVADVAVDLMGELFVTEAQGHGVGGDIVEKLGSGDTLERIRTGSKAMQHGVGDVRHKFLDHAASAFGVCCFFLLAGEVVHTDAERAEDNHGIAEILKERDDKVVDAGFREPINEDLRQESNSQQDHGYGEELVAVEAGVEGGVRHCLRPL